jgi:transcriptional regulator with XRE-family HTH domain
VFDGDKAPGALRRHRLLRGTTLKELVGEVERICQRRGLARGRLSRGELSRIERGQRWINAQQLAALAEAHGVPPGTACEWMLADRGLLDGEGSADGLGSAPRPSQRGCRS